MNHSFELSIQEALTTFTIFATVFVVGGFLTGLPNGSATLDTVYAQKVPAAQPLSSDSMFANPVLAQADTNIDEYDQTSESEQVETDVETDYARLLAQADTSSNGSCVYLVDDLRIDFNNSSTEVMKLQTFLKTLGGYSFVDVTGDFDSETLRAVNQFQMRYADEILEPWGYDADEPTGYVYITTRQKINEIVCDQQFNLTAQEQQEISAYRTRLASLKARGVDVSQPQYLANYYGQRGTTGSVAGAMYGSQSSDKGGSSAAQRDSNTTSLAETDSSTDDAVAQADDAQETDVDDMDDTDSPVIDDELTVGTSATDTTATSATSSDDGRGFLTNLAASVYNSINNLVDYIFANDDTATTTPETATSSDAESDDAEDQSEATTSASSETAASAEPEILATSTSLASVDNPTSSMGVVGSVSGASLSGIEALSANVYLGVSQALDSTLSFLLSPTLLLVLLGVLVLLLVATLLASKEEDAPAQATSSGKQTA